MKQLIGTLLISLFSLSAHAAPIFARPLHLTRVVEESLGDSRVSIDEYCTGERFIAVVGSRVSIVDYARGELTEIDRARNTYSVTEFTQIARVRNADARVKSQKLPPWKRQQLPSRTAAGRDVEVVEIIATGTSDSPKVEIAFDRSLVVSRAAAEVLIGAAFPNIRRPEHDAILSQEADAAQGKLAQDVPLPLELIFEFEDSGETIRVTNRVTRVGGELVPEEVLTIPAGARKVESTLVTRQRLLEELDKLPSSSKH